jgi:hypothetical protein
MTSSSKSVKPCTAWSEEIIKLTSMYQQSNYLYTLESVCLKHEALFAAFPLKSDRLRDLPASVALPIT